MTLSLPDIYNGSLSLIFAIITLFVGLRIASKYFKYGDKNLIYVGIGWIGISCPYISAGFSFLIALINETGLPTQIYFLIAAGITPIFLVLWTLAITNLLYQEYKKLIISIVVTISVLALSFFIYAIFFGIDLIGYKQGISDTEWSTFMKIYFISLILYVLATGLLFGVRSLKSSNPEIKLKGKFLIVAFVLLTFGAIIDSILDDPLTRVIMMISAILFYFGWIMPEFIKKRLAK
ncbi:MAG: hypothetical protein GF317_21640|nr:hypothetical protein [Candidatus Lokiarchaeota archaeon]MBD3202065.1 hypothetical protein [Candidatus Lokiarchaeota archaeon]